jgi:hypothetical protein
MSRKKMPLHSRPPHRPRIETCQYSSVGHNFKCCDRLMIIAIAMTLCKMITSHSRSGPCRQIETVMCFRKEIPATRKAHDPGMGWLFSPCPELEKIRPHRCSPAHPPLYCSDGPGRVLCSPWHCKRDVLLAFLYSCNRLLQALTLYWVILHMKFY